MNKMANKKFEVEMRVQVNQPGITFEKLASLGATLVKETSQLDKYFKCEKDIERKLIIRIRDTGDKQKLTFKGSIKSGDGAWQEWEHSIVGGENLADLFLQNGYCEVVTINKKRKSYHLNNFEINVDEIKGLGIFVEVELMHDNIEEAKKEIQNFLVNKLGISIDNIITKGYVPLMLEKKNIQDKQNCQK